MKIWEWSTFIGIECFISLGLIIFGLLICCKFPKFIFNKFPMTSLYICYFVALTTNIVWNCLHQFNRQTNAEMYAFLLFQIFLIAV